MAAYVVRRLFFMMITLLGIILLNFTLVQFMPGGPVEQIVARLSGKDGGAGGFGGATDVAGGQGAQSFQGGIDPKLIKELEKQFGLDKPFHERLLITIKQFATFQFGDSYYRDANVVELIKERLPVTMSLGLWTLFFAYLISVPLGIAKAVRDGSKFDALTSGLIIIGYAIPSFVMAVFLMVIFAGGSFLEWFPLQGLQSEVYSSYSVGQCMMSFACLSDYFWHITLPVIAMLMGSFATIAMLTKNSFVEEIRKQYVTTARAKGLSERKILYGHVFRNAMLIILANFPSALVHAIFTGAILIEVIFGLNGMGLLAFEAAINRDFPVVLGVIYILGLVSLMTKLVGDLLYVAVDPRIDFEKRDV